MNTVLSKTVYTLGYGSLDLREFLEILNHYNVSIVVDVRRFPKSKKPYFSKDSLSKILANHGITYYWLGNLLGGYRKGGYIEYTKTKEYRLGINILVHLIRYTFYNSGKTVILCLEKHPRGCHRKYIAQTLQDTGIRVLHILDDKQVIPHTEEIMSHRSNV